MPVNFRRGIQVPLFKGKNLCSTSTDNYRGITLLSTFSKIYEMLIWGRLEPWWKEHGIISQTQGACRKGQSCVHTSLILQETISKVLETNNKVFVSYFDVSKAFDTVWINGLFFKLYELGVRGKLWRLMYRTYKKRICRVRVAGNYSDWFPMHCGIHQVFFLSLTKYITFINALLVDLEASELCCTIAQIPSSPAGYADDLATATISKFRTDKVHTMVFNYGKKWRFNFNASKSAVMVFGEEKKVNCINKTNRIFRLGSERVKEKDVYDHVGVKMCLFKDNTLRVEEKISKGRRTLNASTGLGIRKNGLNMLTCNIIFWQVVIPTVTFGSEVWVMSDKDEDNLLSFQRYAGRRVQRFPQRSPNASCFYGLGWLRITSFIKVKKLLFILTILKMSEDMLTRRVFEKRLNGFCNNREQCSINVYRSPIFDMLNVAVQFGLLETIRKMTTGESGVTSKEGWSKIIWKRAWTLDDADWRASNMVLRDNDLLSLTIGNSRYLTWWHISDIDHQHIQMCENMSKIVCHASVLKRDDCRLKGMSMCNKTCEMCNMFCVEDIFHLIMQCPHFESDINDMYEEIYRSCPNARLTFEQNQGEVFYFLLGRRIPEWDEQEMICLWCIAGNTINRIYNRVISSRTGIG